MKKVEQRATLRSLRGYALGQPEDMWLHLRLRPNLPRQTLHIPKTLYEIPHATFKKVYIILWNQQNERR